MINKIYVGIDESGITTSHFRNIKKVKNNIYLENQFIGIAFIVIEEKFMIQIYNKLQSIKQKHLYYGKIHTNKLFSNIKYKDLIFDIFELIKNSKFTIYYGIIDVNSFYLNSNYKELIDPYFLICRYLLERIERDFYFYKKSLVIESRSWKQDLLLQKYLFEYFINNNYNYGDITFLNKRTVNWKYLLIELADFVAFLILKDFKSELGKLASKINVNILLLKKTIREVIYQKFFNFPITYGYSLKIIN